MYNRGELEQAREVTSWGSGVSWFAHPSEGSKRASHAIVDEEGVWILDPLDATNIDELIDPLGDVAGILVLSCWHSRDAGTFARRYDVSVHIPAWMDRVESRVDAPVKRYTLRPDNSTFKMLPCRPFPRWQEMFLYDESSKTLVIPDSMGTIETSRIGTERLGLEFYRRLQPPKQLLGLEPDRILVGHGEPVTDGATEALRTALTKTRRTFPRAVTENGIETVKAIYGAVK